MLPPNKIQILSDGNELIFKEIILPKGAKEKIFIYEYSKSITKKGELLKLNETNLIKLINNK